MKVTTTLLTAAAFAVSIGLAGSSDAQAPAQAITPAVVQSYQEIFAASQREKRGINVLVRGQTIGGAVVRVNGNDAVELRNQQYSRIVIRMDSIDAISMP